MYRKFKHLNIPDGWEQYWSKYPNGYSMLEGLIDWVSQVDDMVDNVNIWNEYLDNFVATFDKELQQTVTTTLSEWQNSGFLNVVISEALQWELDDFKTTTQQNFISVDQQIQQTEQSLNVKLAENEEKIDSLGVNINKYKHLVVNDDWTNAIQTALDNHKHIFFPEGVYKYTNINISNFGTTISGSGQKYGGSVLKHIGTGVSIKVEPSVNYLTLNKMHVEGSKNLSTDFYNAGTVGIDLTGGATIVMDDCRLQNFETLVKSNYDSFYNKFLNSRFSECKYILDGFNINNLEIHGNRIQMFHTAFRVNGSNGSLTISKNSIEYFNGFICQTTGLEKGIVTFKDNYVEIFDTQLLPSNFPNSALNNGRYGGNILFGGSYEVLTLETNEMQLGGVFRVVSATSCEHLVSRDNLLHIYTTNNNLERLFFVSDLKSCYINDQRGTDVGVDGGYSREYTSTRLLTTSPYGMNYNYDCLIDKLMIPENVVYTPILTNGWEHTTEVGYGDARIVISKEGLHLQGVVDGTNSTGIEIFTIPENIRPLIYNTLRNFCLLITYSDLGTGEKIRLRYLYNAGVLRLEGSPTSKSNITLDGLFIPIQV